MIFGMFTYNGLRKEKKTVFVGRVQSLPALFMYQRCKVEITASPSGSSNHALMSQLDRLDEFLSMNNLEK